MSISVEQEMSEQEIAAYAAAYREDTRIEMERVRQENEKRQWGIYTSYDNEGKFYRACPESGKGTMTFYESHDECDRLEILHRLDRSKP